MPIPGLWGSSVGRREPRARAEAMFSRARTSSATFASPHDSLRRQRGDHWPKLDAISSRANAGLRRIGSCAAAAWRPGVSAASILAGVDRLGNAHVWLRTNGDCRVLELTPVV